MKEKDKRFWWKLTAITWTAAFVGWAVLLGYPHAENLRGETDWNAERTRWDADNQPKSIGDLLPPAVSDDQNMATAPVVAWWFEEFGGPVVPAEHRQLVDLAKKLIEDAERGFEAESDHLFDWRIGRFFSNWSDSYLTCDLEVDREDPVLDPGAMLRGFECYDVVFKELEGALERPNVRYPIQWDQLDKARLPHLSRIKAMSQILVRRALARLEVGASNEATKDLATAIRLGNTTRCGTCMISALIHVANVEIVARGIWQAIGQRRLDRNGIKEMQEAFGSIDLLEHGRQALLNERFLLTETVESLVEIWPSPWQVLVHSVKNLEIPGSAGAPKGWLRQSQVYISKVFREEMLPAIDVENRRVYTDKVVHAQRSIDEAFSTVIRRATRFLAVSMLPGLPHALEKYGLGQSTIDLAVTACALERYWIDHGVYPEALKALEPVYLETVPHDVMTGEPLKYRREGERFVLYSFGLNGVDDGGVVELDRDGDVDFDEGDLVWQYPVD